jgi:hypothetical protein
MLPELDSVKGITQINDVISFLMSNGKHMASLFNSETHIGKLYIANWLTLCTFRPLPDAFLKYDIDNYPESFKDVILVQTIRYGESGSINYNLNINLGCCCDAEINSMCVSVVDNERLRIDLYVETGNTPCEKWVKNIKDDCGFDYAFIHEVDYDGYSFNNFKEIDDNDEKEFATIYAGLDPDADDDIYGYYDSKVENYFEQYVMKTIK